ncbi:MAG: DUF1343 domain-containing protein [Syntrophobacteraceae bacterium]|nr:DUF1343 domain-containing protein [Syntrophobacteraceae bacterium]
MSAVIPGCEVLLRQTPGWFRNARLGVLVNQASVTREFMSVQDAIGRAGGRVCCLFSPQHGYHADRQANMIESADEWDHAASIPIFSLYSEVRQPSREMLQSVDVLIIDLQDVGTRVYTYGTTVGLCVEAVDGLDLKIVVLDRPNPINGSQVEGNLLAAGFESFVGRYGIPMRHGLTMGELARLVVREKALDVDLDVIAMAGWRRTDFFPQTSLPWIFPSPNMPTGETALLYPGMVLLEGTNVSEGRGTTLPFHLFGAPFLDQKGFLSFLGDASLPGAVFRPVCYEPRFDKWKGELCYGFQVHVTERELFRPYLTGLAVLQAFLTLHPREFSWLPPPYEYEYEKMPVDILLGDGRVREELEKGVSIWEMEQRWLADLKVFERLRQEILIYEEA